MPAAMCFSPNPYYPLHAYPYLTPTTPQLYHTVIPYTLLPSYQLLVYNSVTE